MRTPTLDEAEIISNIEAYKMYPWGEEQIPDDVERFLLGLRKNPDGFVMIFREAEKDKPYLYVNGLNYKGRIKDFIEEEFTSNNAYWQTTEKAKIEEFFKNTKSLTYINNIHADKTVDISEGKKPRLRVLPEILDRLFTDNSSEVVALFTHRDTGVSRELKSLDVSRYKVESIDYKAKCVTPRNSNFGIDYLTAYKISLLA